MKPIDYRAVLDRLIYAALPAVLALGVHSWDGLWERIQSPAFVLPLVGVAFGISLVPSQLGDKTPNLLGRKPTDEDTAAPAASAPASVEEDDG